MQYDQFKTILSSVRKPSLIFSILKASIKIDRNKTVDKISTIINSSLKITIGGIYASKNFFSSGIYSE